MNVQIERRFIEAMIEAFPELAYAREQLKFGDRVELGFRQLSDAQFSMLETLYRQAGPEMQARAAQMATLRHALNDDGVRFGPNDLEHLLPAMLRYLLAGAIRGWVFTANVSSKPLPYVVTKFDFTPASNDETGKLFIELKANAKGAITTNTVRISASDTGVVSSTILWSALNPMVATLEV